MSERADGHVSVWFTSDLHIGHRNIVTYCARPFSGVEENDAGLARRWNERVAADDVVWILGDISFLRLEPTRSYLESLAGRK